jgi:hypothetical protein
MAHPNKHICEALKLAISLGWELVPSRGHAYCVIRCSFGARGGCQKSVWSTPKNPEGHARDIVRYAQACPH